MFKSLFINQFRSILFTMFTARGGKRSTPAKSAGKKLLITLLTVYVVACMFFFFGMMFVQLCSPLVESGMDTVYFVLVAIMTFLFMFIGSVFITQKQLYEATDNELLLSMPIPPVYIVISRMTAILLVNLMYGAFTVIPAFVVYSMATGFSISVMLIMLIASLLLSVLALCLSAVCGWLLALLLSNLKRKKIFSTVFMLAFFFAIMGFYMNLQKILNKLVIEGAALADAMRKVFPPFYFYGKAVAETDMVSLILLILITLIPAALITFLISKSFIKIATKNKGSAGKYKYTAKKLNASSPRRAMFFKEFRRFFSSPNYFINAGLGSIFMIIIAVALAVKGLNIIPSETFAELPDTVSADRLLPLIVGAVMLFCTTTNLSACSSLSLEGKYYPSLRAMPLSYGDIILPKIAVNFVWGFIPILPVVAVCALRLHFSFADCLFIFLLTAVSQLFTSLFGMLCNVFLPKFDWISEVVVIKQSASVMLTLLGSMGILGIFVLLFILAGTNIGQADLDSIISATMPAAVVFYVIMSIIIGAVLYTSGKKKFNSYTA